MTGAELERLLFAHIPENFLERTLRAVYMAHAVAWEDCRSSFATTESENVLGYYRRGKLEGYLRDTADLFEGLEAVVVRSPKSNWNHTEVRGGPVVLTENSVSTPCALVDKSEFRMTLAKSNQLSLLPEEELPTDAPLFALLLHSRSQWETIDERQKYGHLPGSAYLAFPARDLNDYLHRINLFQRFPAVVAAHLPSEWTDEVQLRYLRRARQVGIA